MIWHLLFLAPCLDDVLIYVASGTCYLQVQPLNLFLGLLLLPLLHVAWCIACKAEWHVSISQLWWGNDIQLAHEDVRRHTMIASVVLAVAI